MLRFRGPAVSGRPPLEGIDHLHAQLADRQLSHWHRLQKYVFNAINLHACMVRCQFIELDVSQCHRGNLHRVDLREPSYPHAGYHECRPFEGGLNELLRDRRIVLAETCPVLAYGAALAGELPTSRVLVSKTRPEQRRAACEQIARARWVESGYVDPGDLGPVQADRGS